jgi:IS30 family transposase
MAYQRLNYEERILISIRLREQWNYQSIAEELNRSKGTISREINRGCIIESGLMVYSAAAAHHRASEQAQRFHRKSLLLEQDGMLKLVIQKLRKRWSPQKISTWLKHHKNMSVSHETIYQYIYVQAKAELKKELISMLRQHKPKRQKRGQIIEKRGVIPDMISIEQRPAEVADRSVPGHWEGDLIVGKDHQSALGTLVERSTRYLLMVHLKSKDAESVRLAFAKKLRSMPRDLKRSLTYDRGKEMAQHKQFTISTKMQVYFCHPHSPWQRGTNENTNGLVRDFFPKGTDFSKVSKQEVSKVQRWINERPRETLNNKTPIEAIKELFSQL